MPRQVLRSSVLDMRLRMGLQAAWDQRTLCVPTEVSYVTTTRSEIVKIANAAWLPWRETGGGGNCEVQCFNVIVQAWRESVKQQLNGRLAVYAALTRGDMAHAYVIGETSPTTVEIYDQTAGQFVTVDQMDKPVRVIYA